MRILINALAMRSLGHGVGNYIGNLGYQLAKDHPEDEFTFLVNPGNRDLPQLLKDLSNVSIEVVSLPRPLRVIWEQLVLPFIARGYDVLHCPVYVSPVLKFTRYVLTILDLTFFTEPKEHNIVKRIYFRTMIPLSVRTVDKILTISNSGADDLQKILDVPEGKIEVTLLAIPNGFRRVRDVRKLSVARRKYHLPKRFILFLGVLEPRKNVTGLITAFAGISAKTELDLVIAGSSGFGWNNSQIQELIENPDLKKRVHLIGTVKEQDKAALYSLAEVFAYPSFYEGFGIPVLEAMACGVPVVTSSGSSLEEVAGGAALLIDPHSNSDIARAILRLTRDRDLRARLSKLGLANVRRFSWSATARKTYNAYKATP